LSSVEIWNQIVSKRITVDPEKCIGCGNCVRVCAFMVYQIKKIGKKKIAVPTYQDDCFLCQSCQADCPGDAITIEW